MKKVIILVFIILTFIDFYNCTQPGHEDSQWFRPTQVLILLLWVFQSKPPLVQNLAISSTLIIALISDYVFYKYGSKAFDETIILVVLKNVFFIFILFKNYKYAPSQKLFRWAIIYIFIFIVICTLIDGFEHWMAYIIAIQSAFILLLVSLQKKESNIFRQLYLGYCLIIMSLIFGKILLKDSRWFIEALSHFTFIFGHLLFVSGLANIKLFPNKLEYQTVEH